MDSQLPVLPSITKLSKSVTRLLGQNPSKFTLQGTNCYLVGSSHSLTLIDTAQDEKFVPILKEALKELSAHGGKVRVENIIITHYHSDHVGGLKFVLELLKEFGFTDQPTIWKFPSSKVENDTFLNEVIGENGWKRLEHGMKFQVGSEESLECLFSPGHTDDSISLLLNSASSNSPSLFTADTILGHSTAIFEDLFSYLNTLEAYLTKLESFTGQGKIQLYPGHGEIVEDGVEKIKSYIQHRLEREAQVLAALLNFCSVPGVVLDSTLATTAAELTKTIYGGTIPDSLLPAATRGVLLHLEKLEKDKEVIRIPNLETDDANNWLPGWNDNWRILANL